MSAPDLRFTERGMTSDEYLRSAELGHFKGERVELLRGRVVRMAPQGPMHSWTIEELNHVLVEHFGKLARVRPKTPMRASPDSVPEPDFVLVERWRGPPPRPHPSKVLLVVEIADSSLETDRSLKQSLYTDGTPEYWIVNLRDRVLEVFRKPEGGRFTERLVLGPDDSIRTVSFPDIEVQVSAFLPRATT